MKIPFTAQPGSPRDSALAPNARAISRGRIFASVVFAICSLAFDAIAEAKNASKAIVCVAARGRVTYKIESRCMNIRSDHAVRTYRIYVPKKAPKTPMPLLLVLHGGGGSGSAMEAMTLGQFNRVADKRRAIVVYPDGVGRNWNDGRTALRADAMREGADDVGFLRGIIDDIAARNAVDRKRIYATGISNGGLMSFRLACDGADWIAAVAPVAANMSPELTGECRPARMVPIAIFNGTDDPVMPWIGGEIKMLWNRRGEVLSAQESFEYWMKYGDCALPITHAPRNHIVEDGTSVVRHVARECKDGAEVRLYEILGGGHTWPSGNPRLFERAAGKVSRELNAGEEIWSFVSRFALP